MIETPLVTRRYRCVETLWYRQCWSVWTLWQQCWYVLPTVRHWCQSVLGPKCLGSEVSVHLCVCAYYCTILVHSTTQNCSVSYRQSNVINCSGSIRVTQDAHCFTPDGNFIWTRQLRWWFHPHFCKHADRNIKL